jgi:predicted N-acetyltransferase YhbS
LTGDRIDTEGVAELLKIDANLPRLIVAESDSKVIGTLELEIEDRTSVVYGLFSVLAAYQSKGIGKKLLTDGISRSKEQGYTTGVMYVIEIRADLLAWLVKRL